jgi:hypothetical protein
MKWCILLGIALAGLCITGCNKDVPAEKSDLIGSVVNDQYLSFNYFTKAKVTHPASLNLPYGYWENLYFLSIWGFNEENLNSNFISITVASDKAFSSGVYNHNSSGLPFVQIIYNFYEGQNLVSTEATDPTVSITSVSEKHIKGTFSCTIFYNDNMARRKEIQIKDGRFDLDFGN